MLMALLILKLMIKMSEFFFHSMSEAHLQTLDVNVDSVICYIDVELDDKEVKTEIVENGFSAELDQDMCDTKMPQESHFRSGGESCPVGLQKAALLYPLCGEGKPEHCMCHGCLCLGLPKGTSSVIAESLSSHKSSSYSVEKLFKI